MIIVEQTNIRIRALASERKATKGTMDATASCDLKERELQKKVSTKEKEHNGTKQESGDTGKGNSNSEEKQDNRNVDMESPKPLEDLPPVQSVSVARGKNTRMGIRKEREFCDYDDNNQTSLLVDDEAMILDKG